MRDTPTPPAVDMPLLTALIMLCALSLVVLYSAGDESPDLLLRQGMRIGVALVLMLMLAHVPPSALRRWTPWLYLAGLTLLIGVLAAGFIGRGAQRWLDFGVFRFQPAEGMKLAVPMMVAWILTRTPLPPRPLALLMAVAVVLLPAVLVLNQPDLGTAILIILAGGTVIFLAGIGYRLVAALLLTIAAAAPLLWTLLLHDYQRRRIITFLDPSANPADGYHINQSLIAVGSGGLYGKGWLAGTQTQLDFIPERSTDFAFAVFAEEFGYLGALVLLTLYLFVCVRGMVIAYHAADTYSRLLGGCLAATFFCYVFVNISMVVGLLPVVGVPLPLISHGGSSLVTLMLGFGILMSIQRHHNILQLGEMR